MRFLVKLLMFIGAYSPLWAILWWRHFGVASPWGWAGVAILALALAPLGLLFGLARLRTKSEVVLVEADEVTSDSLNYIIPYLLALPGFDYSRGTDIAIISMVLVIIFAVYSNSNLYYVNPVLFIVGLHIFKVRSQDRNVAMLIARKAPQLNRPEKVRRMHGNILWRVTNG